MVVGYPVVLASASPRRKELLSRIIDEFDVVPSAVDETGQSDAAALARAKAEDVFMKRPDAVVIGSDTVVLCGGVSMGKPESAQHAVQMLRELSGKTHSVVTGVSIIWPGGETTFTEPTLVTFRELTDAEIQSYVATGEPMDKAGAYAIQGGAASFVENIDGDYDNVVGLPVERLEQALTITVAAGL